MKKTLLLAAFFAGISIQAQEVIFEDDFESYDDFAIADIGDWTLIDGDGASTYGLEGVSWPNAYQPIAFIVFNSNETSPPLAANQVADWDANSGEKCMTSFASVNAVNDDWLISPQMTLGSSGNLLTFFAKAASSEYSDEAFNVGISTTDTDPSSFTFILNNEIPDAIDWEQFSVNLDSYANQTVYIAINHVADDQFGFQIDDFKVVSGVLSTDQVAFEGFSQFIANGQLHLKANENMTHVSIYNALGQEVYNKNLNNTSAALDIAQFQTGVYIATVSIGGAKKSFRVLIN